MKLAPVSTDLLIKLALVAGGIALAVYWVRRSTNAVSDAVGSAAAAISDTVDSVIVGVNPANPSNWVNQAVTAGGGALVSATGPGRNADGSWTVGGWLYDITHPDPAHHGGTSSGSAPELSGWGSETRPRAVFDSSTQKAVDYGQLSSLGAP